MTPVQTALVGDDVPVVRPARVERKPAPLPAAQLELVAVPDLAHDDDAILPTGTASLFS